MTDTNFDAALDLVLAHEGGYVNHPKDPGGPTNKGITKAVYDAYRTSNGLPIRSVKEITKAELRAIYKNQYWLACGANLLPTGLDYAVFDFAVNSGPGRAVAMLQRVVGVGADRDFGEITRAAACHAMDLDEVGTIEELCADRLEWLKTLHGYSTFGAGWKRRVVGDFDGTQESDHGVVDYATKMALKDMEYPIPKAQLPSAIGSKPGEVAAKAPDSAQAPAKTAQGKGILTAAAGAAGTGIAGATAIANQAQQASTAAQTGVNAAVGVHKAVTTAAPLVNTNVLLLLLIVFMLLTMAGAGYAYYTLRKQIKDKG